MVMYQPNDSQYCCIKKRENEREREREREKQRERERDRQADRFTGICIKSLSQ